MSGFTSILGAFICFYLTGTLGAVVSVPPPARISQVAGSSVSLPVTFSNVSANSTFTWYVGSTSVANVTFTDGALTDNTTSSGYNLESFNDTMYDVNMKLTIKILMSAQNNSVVMVTGDGVSANTTLNLVPCGASPIGSGCLSYMCQTNSSTFKGSTRLGNQLYDCYNTSQCMADGKWTTVTKMCGNTVVACTQPMWGSDCSKSCGMGCPVSGMCDFTTGTCLDQAGVAVGCKMGYSGGRCDMLAMAACPAKTWGPTCNKTCGSGCYNNCNKTTGQCLDLSGTALMTNCIPGYKGALCDQVGCENPNMWGPNCTKVCGGGCPNGICRFADGLCLNNGTNTTTTSCLTGYNGMLCDQPICPGGCSGGTCLDPNYCGNCPTHFAQQGTRATGVTCRNIRLDGFLKGSLPTFAVLTVIVILLTVTSKWYIRRKIKQN